MQIAVDWDRPPGGQSDTLPLLRGGVIVDTPEHTAAVDLMLNKLNSGVEESHLTLTDCLKAFTSDEELDDGSWYDGITYSISILTLRRALGTVIDAKNTKKEV